MKLKDRIAGLERRVEDARPHTPAMFFWKQQEKLEQAKEAYKQRYGYELPPDGHIIQFVACDMSREGNGRELTREEYQREVSKNEKKFSSQQNFRAIAGQDNTRNTYRPIGLNRPRQAGS